MGFPMRNINTSMQRMGNEVNQDQELKLINLLPKPIVDFARFKMNVPVTWYSIAKVYIETGKNEKAVLSHLRRLNAEVHEESYPGFHKMFFPYRNY